MAPTGKVVVSASTLAGRTTVEWHDVRSDAISSSVQIDGELHPTAVAQDGKLVALIGSAPSSTTVVLATPSDGEVRRWTFDAVLVPEAFANAAQVDGLPIGIFVIEYLAEHTYRVRVIDTATGELGLPLNLRDKSQTVDEVMTAVSRTAVFDPGRQLLFTLYQDASEGGENIGSFIHTLGLINGVWCLDVPPELLGLADHPGALAVSPDGSRLYAASSTGGVAGYVVDDITDGTLAMPEARATAALGGSSSRVAIGASNDEVVVALGGRLFRLDPTTLEVRDSFTWDMDVEALTVLDDGSIVIVGTRRMTLVSPHDNIRRAPDRRDRRSHTCGSGALSVTRSAQLFLTAEISAEIRGVMPQKHQPSQTRRRSRCRQNRGARIRCGAPITQFRKCIHRFPTRPTGLPANGTQEHVQDWPGPAVRRRPRRRRPTRRSSAPELSTNRRTRAAG